MSDWDYKHPINVWESMPWFIRWPLAVVFIIVAIFFLTAPFHPWIKHSHGHTPPSAEGKRCQNALFMRCTKKESPKLFVMWVRLQRNQK